MMGREGGGSRAGGNPDLASPSLLPLRGHLPRMRDAGMLEYREALPSEGDRGACRRLKLKRSYAGEGESP